MLDNMWNKTNAFLLACAMLALSAAPAAAQQAQPQGPYGPGPWWADGYAWSFWWICPLMMLVMFGIMGVIMLARHHRGDGHWTPPWPAPTSLRILDERFARGEIQKDEYEAKRAAILSGR